MPTLLELRSQHSTLLVLDASSSVVHVGLHRQGSGWTWAQDQAEAGVGIFSLVEKICVEQQLALIDVEAFAFCEAPGSVLGIRTAAVALRVWNALKSRPVFSYNGLAAVAHHVQRLRCLENADFIADARRESWHTVSVRQGVVQAGMCRLKTADLGETRLTPAGFRRWSTLPSEPESVPYEPRNFLVSTEALPLFSPASEPDAFLHEEPVYQTWTPQVHRAPSSAS